ncbi:hypothetical protein KVV02_004412 [Mortierella alpina]|uniref:4'-phosphopantetheinyl transferase domain-containing protein n=1 Tax=Mortierella alpina TaxID=64518 RepID=A0A9P8CUI6_MORAP|nr:hypothetical protein KVV02_004412 [Mortierella alpina]
MRWRISKAMKRKKKHRRNRFFLYGGSTRDQKLSQTLSTLSHPQAFKAFPPLPSPPRLFHRPSEDAGAFCKTKMTILGIGVDILHLPRLRRVLLNHPERFLTRILTKSEQTEFRAIQAKAGGKIDHDGPVQFLGARWALKEACYKAIYPHHKLTWQDVSVIKENGMTLSRSASPHLLFTVHMLFNKVY